MLRRERRRDPPNGSPSRGFTISQKFSSSSGLCCPATGVSAAVKPTHPVLWLEGEETGSTLASYPAGPFLRIVELHLLLHRAQQNTAAAAASNLCSRMPAAACRLRRSHHLQRPGTNKFPDLSNKVPHVHPDPPCLGAGLPASDTGRQGISVRVYLKPNMGRRGAIDLALPNMYAEMGRDRKRSSHPRCIACRIHASTQRWRPGNR